MIGIYKITNNLNQKSYIGQSIHIEQRWEEHLYKTSGCTLLKYALYKYGVHNFSFDVIEECPQELLNEREQYWIQYYDSFNNGYNLTLGGGGTVKYSIEAIYEDYCQTGNMQQTARNFGAHVNTVRNILKEYGINETAQQKEKVVHCIDPITLEIKYTFNSVQDAADAMHVNRSAITMALTGRHKSCANYYWKYADEEKVFPAVMPKQWKTAVQQINRITGEVIQEFSSAADAAEALGKDRKNGGSQISAVCSGRKPTAYGYIWKKI